jgi:hypothetical protein
VPAKPAGQLGGGGGAEGQAGDRVHGDGLCSELGGGLAALPDECGR